MYGKNEYIGGKLIVFAPGVLAFRTAEEPYLALVCRAKLPEPPFRRVMAATRAFHACGGERRHILVAVDDRDLPLQTLMCFHHRFVVGYLLDMPTLSAFQLTT